MAISASIHWIGLIDADGLRKLNPLLGGAMLTSRQTGGPHAGEAIVIPPSQDFMAVENPFPSCSPIILPAGSLAVFERAPKVCSHAPHFLIDFPTENREGLSTMKPYPRGPWSCRSAMTWTRRDVSVGGKLNR